MARSRLNVLTVDLNSWTSKESKRFSLRLTCHGHFGYLDRYPHILSHTLDQLHGRGCAGATFCVEYSNVDTHSTTLFS